MLRHPAAWRALGNWETRLLRGRLAQVRIDRPVFIAGLARAGTTILLRKLCALPGFVSHRYADFPFLFTPYAWSRLRGPPRREVARERMHKDRIMITAESPEAMEEVLWTAFFPDLHLPGRSNALDRSARNAAFEAFLREHIQKLLLVRGGGRYVSKNNYNVTRLPYLANLFPGARFLIPVRDPVAHVASLMKQQSLFSRIGQESTAARRHLALVGHFEFGLDRRPINLGADTAAVRESWARGEEARGWAKYWALIYRHVLDVLEADPDLRGRAMLVSYEALCRDPETTLAAVAAHVGAKMPAEWGRELAEPDYYRAAFTGAEQAAIAEETHDVADRIRAALLTGRARSPGPSPAAAWSWSPPAS